MFKNIFKYQWSESCQEYTKYFDAKLLVDVGELPAGTILKEVTAFQCGQIVFVTECYDSYLYKFEAKIF